MMGISVSMWAIRRPGLQNWGQLWQKQVRKPMGLCACVCACECLCVCSFFHFKNDSGLHSIVS